MRILLGLILVESLKRLFGYLVLAISIVPYEWKSCFSLSLLSSLNRAYCLPTSSSYILFLIIHAY
jgi:hypothetical protein